MGYGADGEGANGVGADGVWGGRGGGELWQKREDDDENSYLEIYRAFNSVSHGNLRLPPDTLYGKLDRKV